MEHSEELSNVIVPDGYTFGWNRWLISDQTTFSLNSMKTIPNPSIYLSRRC